MWAICNQKQNKNKLGMFTCAFEQVLSAWFLLYVFLYSITAIVPVRLCFIYISLMTLKVQINPSWLVITLQLSLLTLNEEDVG